ncbi:MAG: DUF2975 domain-containing protein [Candidatus Atribacteria bacterium]|nr:DUF2975 domain-containing protein [Candidatus Atribacteria bacterium]
MTGKSTPQVRAEVKALRIVFTTLLILYGLVFASALVFLATVFPSFGFSAGAGFWADIRIFLDKVLTGAIYFFIAYWIFRLISLISRGEPFSPASPRLIRRIGCAVLGLAVINAIVNAISEFTSPGVHASEAILRILYSGLTTVLLGFGFLIIARVFEAGVRLQQDQNLTV